MARVERYTSAEPVPVEQAQLVDPSAFPFSMAGPETLQQIGGVLSELGRRKLAADDSLAINAAGESRNLAKLQMKQFMLSNPDPDTWAEGAANILSDQRKIYAQQKFSAAAKANEDIEQQAFTNELLTGVQIANVTQTIENDITVSGKNLIDVIAQDDGSTTAAADIDKQIKLYQAALERKYPKGIADIQMEETLREASKERVAVLVRQDRFDEAEKLVEQATGLTARDRKAQLDIIDRARSAAKRARDKQLEELQEQTAIEYSGRVAEVRTSQDAISLMADVDEDIANGTLDRKVGEGYKRELVKGTEVPTDWNVHNKLVLDIEAVRDGKKDFIEVFNEIQTHRGQDLNGSEIDALTASVRTAKSIAENELPPVQANQLKRYQRILTAYFNADMFGKRDKNNLAESSAKYADKAQRLDSFFTEEHTTKEQEDFFKALTEDAAGEGFLDRLWKYLGTVEPMTFGIQVASEKRRQILKEYSAPPIPLPKPTNQAEYDLLPIGQEYIHPDGTKKVKQ